MPKADNTAAADHLLRTMLYGVGKTKKTWWACRFAEYGFNVVLLDGDDGAHIVRQLPVAAQSKIDVVKLTTKGDTPTFCRFIAQFLKAGNSFFWDEQERRSKIGGRIADHSHYAFHADKLTPNDVLVIDSWTALCESAHTQYCNENEVDLSDFKEVSDKFGAFGFEGNFLNWVLMRLHALPCHVIVIAHATIYEKWDRRDKKNPKLVEQLVQPISCSGPHGKKLAKHFSDVLFFERLSSDTYYIDTAGTKDRDGGSRLLKPEKANWNEITPKRLLDAIGAKALPGQPCAGALWYPPGADFAAAKVAPLTAVTSNPVPAATPIIGNKGGLLGQLKLKAGG